MTRYACLLAAILTSTITMLAAHADLTLADNGKTSFKILVASGATPPVKYAAEELQRWLKEITGAELPLVNDGAPDKEPLICVGPHPKAAAVDTSKYGAETYTLKTAGPSLYIAGGQPRGTLYGVYGLLEDHLDCHWFTPDVQSIPKQPKLVIPTLDETVTPPLEYREPFVKECFDGDWAARNRMNGQAATLTEKHGGKIQYYPFVHSFNALIPPAEYFDKHPEYFSLVGGKRIKDNSQLCCTNEDVIKLVTDKVLLWIDQHPEATVFSVSQNDCWNFCMCDKCAALAAAEGSEIAPVLAMVNRVAKVVAEKHPGKIVDTLAYQWTRKPPKTMRPEKNVCVRLCSIECCFAHPFTACDSEQNKAFVRDAEGWSKICNRLWVWDYTTTFAHYLNPFPNLRVRSANIQFVIKNHVTGIFEQDVYNTLGGEFDGLSGYLGAKLLWNPNYDPNKAIADYMNAVYGPAATALRTYLDLIHDKVTKDNIHLFISAGPEDKFLTDDILAQADKDFDEAEKAVADNPTLLDRVRQARMSPDYVIIERSRHDTDKIGVIDHQHFTLKVNPEFAARIHRFIDAGDKAKMTELREQGLHFADYKASLLDLLKDQPLPPREPKKPAAVSPGLAFSYYKAHCNSVGDIAKLKPARNGATPEVGLPAGELDNEFALVLHGYIAIPRDGIYTFHLASNDGAVLWLDGDKTVDNDGPHTLLTKSAATALKRGLHELTLLYFQAGAEKDLELQYQGPDIPNQPVPPNALFHVEGAPIE